MPFVPDTFYSPVAALADTDPVRAAGLVCRAIVTDAGHLRHHAEKLLTKLAGQYPAEPMGVLGAAMLNSEAGWRFFVDKFTDTIAALPVDLVKSWVGENGVAAARCLARHLPPPTLDEHGDPFVPELTAFVLSDFDADERVFQEFCAGVRSFTFMSGDIVQKNEDDATVAAKFQGHSIRRIAEWANYEVAFANRQAKEWRQRDEEDDLL